MIRLDAATLGAKIAAKEVSSTEVDAGVPGPDRRDRRAYHAFLHVAEEQALAEAARVDAAVAAGESLPSPLAGVPLALKDVFTTTDMPTTCGSKILEGWTSPYDATVTARLRAAGIPILGKTNMDEFAMGSSTENSAYGPTRNPWNVDRVPGGSGGGSAAALAAFQAPLAIGTDTGGSIRQPAALTATVGVKPTYGTVSRYGLIACASSLDQGGPCARTVLDTALLHQVIAGHDPKDSTSVDAAVPDVVAAARAGASGDLKGVRIGVVKQLRGDGYQAGVLASFNAAVEQLTALGAEVSEVDCPHFDYSLPAYYLILPSEVSSNLARFDAMRYGLRVGDDGTHSAEEVMALTRAAGFGPEVKRRIMIGTYALSAGYYDAYYNQAQKVRTLIAARSRRGLQERRRADLAGHPDHRVPAGGEGRRSAGDVPVRPVHAAAEPGRPLRDVGAVGPLAGRQSAGRAADHGARAGRRPALPGRCRLRGCARSAANGGLTGEDEDKCVSEFSPEAATVLA